MKEAFSISSSVIIARHPSNFLSRKVDNKRTAARDEISAIETNCSLESSNAYSSWNEVRLHLRMHRLFDKGQDNGWNGIFRLRAFVGMQLHRAKNHLRCNSIHFTGINEN